MLTFTVSSEIYLALESFVAEAARERSIAGVLTQMGDEIRRLTKCFTTYNAFMWFFTCGPKYISSNLFNFSIYSYKCEYSIKTDFTNP